MYEKYLGGASDPGEWWVDKPSRAEDLGPGVTFRLRLACDEHIPPRIVVAYGLREDVRLDRVEAECHRIISDYVAGVGRWNGEPGKVYGDLIPPTLEQWRGREETLTEFRQYVVSRRCPHPGNRWFPGGVKSLLGDVTGSSQMSQRVIESVGLDALQETIRPSDEVMQNWPLTVWIDGKPICFVSADNEDPYNCLVDGNRELRPSSPEDVWGME